MKKIIMILCVAFMSLNVAAQTYEAKVSKDSLSVLKTRIDILKASIKIQELKIEEAEAEESVEKLRLKLLEANGDAKEAASRYEKFGDRTTSANSVNLKEIQKLAKKSQSATQDAGKALDRFNKQISTVENIRSKIQDEERKLNYKSPRIIFEK